MTNNLPAVQTSTALALPVGHNPFLDAAEDMGARSGSLVLRFDGNLGAFTYGKDREELPLGTRLALNASEIKTGWICWKDGEVQEEIMVRITEGKPPAKSDLTDYGPYTDEQDGWSEQASIQLRDVEDGTEYRFSTSSKGGRIGVGNLVRDYGKWFQMNPGKLAIVELANDSFDAKNKAGKSIGKKYAPRFKIVAWEDEDALVAKFAAASDAEDEDDVPMNPATAQPEPARTGGARGRKF